MSNTLSRNITYGRTYCAFEHTGSIDDEHILLLKAKQRKGELEPEDVIILENLTQLTQHRIGQQHAHLIINNYQVLFKTIPLSGIATEESVVNTAFPNIDLDAFYYEIIRMPAIAAIFICRKSYIHELIAEYKKHKIFITGWSLGVTTVVHLLPLLKDKTTVFSSHYQLTLENKELVNLQKEIQPPSPLTTYQLEGLETKALHLTILSGVVHAFGHQEATVDTNAINTQKSIRSDYLQHRFFGIGLPLAIGLLLCLFLGNFLLYNHYFQGVDSLSKIAESNSLQKQRLVRKDSIVSQKQKVFEDVIESASSASSYYIDEIIHLMPETILLDKLAYHPVLRKVRKNKPILLEEGILLVAGNATSNDSLSDWITVLEQLDFVDEVAIQKTEKEFELELSLKGS